MYIFIQIQQSGYLCIRKYFTLNIEGKFNIDGLKGIFTSQPTGIPDRKMGNARGTRCQHPIPHSKSIPAPDRQLIPQPVWNAFPKAHNQAPAPVNHYAGAAFVNCALDAAHSIWQTHGHWV